MYNYIYTYILGRGVKVLSIFADFLQFFLLQ